jgi:hypothetical protein
MQAWDLSSHQLVASAPPPPSVAGAAACCLALSRTGGGAAVGCSDGRVIVLGLADWEEQAALLNTRAAITR